MQNPLFLLLCSAAVFTCQNPKSHCSNSLLVSYVICVAGENHTAACFTGNWWLPMSRQIHILPGKPATFPSYIHISTLCILSSQTSPMATSPSPASLRLEEIPLIFSQVNDFTLPVDLILPSFLPQEFYFCSHPSFSWVTNLSISTPISKKYKLISPLKGKVLLQLHRLLQHLPHFIFSFMVILVKG